jgi:hypothetical protein
MCYSSEFTCANSLYIQLLLRIMGFCGVLVLIVDSSIPDEFPKGARVRKNMSCTEIVVRFFSNEFVVLSLSLCFNSISCNFPLKIKVYQIILQLF